MTAKHNPEVSSASAGTPAAVPLRILMADDHYIVRRGVKRLISDHFETATFGEAADARELLTLCRTEDWSVVLVDINMPGLSGLDVLPELKQLLPKVPVLIMSALPEEEFALRALKNGATGYIDKRTIATEIVVAITRATSGKRYVSAAVASKLAAQLGGEEICLPHEALSQREFQVLRLIAAGKSLKEIATELFLSEKTVGTYRARLTEELSLATNVELTRYALQHRLVE
ncbi:MAG: response regulator transcription factor [Verrucomicrobiota bacterium]